MKGWVRGLLLLGVLSLVAAWGAWTSLERWLRTPVTASAFTHEVASGATMRSALEAMSRRGQVTWGWQWEVWLRARPRECVQQGRHEIGAGWTPREVADALCRTTRRATVRVTIPEGFTRWQVAERLEAAGLGSYDEVNDLIGDPEYLASLGVEGESLEGWLFPDTYEFYTDAAPRVVLARMVTRAREVHASVGLDGEVRSTSGAEVPGSDGLDVAARITLASLVEREARVAEERPRIARVFYNRLARGMRLETDPTCVYDEATWREVPTRSRCRDPENRWSTYVRDGLPPGPIATPGRASLEAVMRPSDEEALLFFVTLPDGTGRHAFAATYREHQENVNRWLGR